MLRIINILLLFALSSVSFCQVVAPPVEDKGFKSATEPITNHETKVIAWRLLLKDYEYACESDDGHQWYIYKNYLAKSESIIKVAATGYMPEFKANNIMYKDVVVKELLIFDCEKESYKIVEGTYYHDFTKLFDVFNNPEGDMNAAKPKTVMSGILKAVCKKFL